MNEFKTIDQRLSPLLVKGGKLARQEVARQLWKHRKNESCVAFIKRISAWTGYPIK